MRILAITDIHGRQNHNTEVKELMSSVDLIVIAGDLTNFGHDKEARSLLQNIQLYNKNILAIPGNCDHPDVNDTLIKMGVNLHGITKTINNIAFYGLGGSGKTPFNTPQECNESDISSILGSFNKENDVRHHVFVSHAPPAKTKLDRTFLTSHVGSKTIREFIDRFKPDVVICGHIHEAQGVDELGSTIMINPGPFPKHYAVIDLLEKITYRLY
ncbi:MAG: metallophosphoesterase [bacterium]